MFSAGSRRTPEIAGSTFAVLVTFIVVLSLCVPAAAAVDEGYGEVEIEAALEDDRDATAIEFSFVASEDGTVTLGDDELIERDGGDVEFEFREWSTDHSSGDEPTWEVTAGEEYTVEYVARAHSGASEQQHTVPVDVHYEDGSHELDEELTLDVAVLEPEFGFIGPVEEEVIVEGFEETDTLTVDLPNVGDGVMVVEDVSFSGEPADVTVSAESVPDQIEADETGGLDIKVGVDDDTAEGTHSFETTVVDSEGNTESVEVSVDVYRPPIAAVPDDPVDLGDVLVEDSETQTVQVDEIGENDGLSGLETELESDDSQGDIEFDVSSWFGTEPGGSDEIDVTVTAAETAPQHHTLDFDVLISGTDEHSPERSVTFTAEVIYPPELGLLDTSLEEFEFDEPRSEVSSQTTQTTVSIPNEGDLEMDVESVSAEVPGSDVSASVVDEPSTVDGLQSEDATVELTGDADAPEGTYQMTVTVETDEAGTETITRQFEIVHGTELAAERDSVAFGEVTITERTSRDIDVGERLGYNDLENVEVTVVDGPDEWMWTAEEPSARIDAGETEPLVFDVEFDTDAEAYQEYVWTVRVDADGVEAETITVSATAQLLSVEDLEADLDERGESGEWQGTATESASGGLSTMEQQLRDGEDIEGGDIRRAITISQSTVVLVDAVETAETRQADGEYESAQSSVVSALVAQNIISEHVAELDSQTAASEFGPVVDATEEPVDALVDEQVNHYEPILEDDDATALERYRASENLAILHAEQGNGEQAEEYEDDAEASFEEYQTLVEEGTEQRQQARDSQVRFEENATLTFLGQPIVLNPARIDEVGQHRSAVDDHYTTAEERFDEAGATAEADTTASEGSTAGTQLLFTQLTLYGVTLVSAFVFAIVVLWEMLNARKFVIESREAASGDFLL